MATKVKSAVGAKVGVVSSIMLLMTKLGQVFTTRYDKKELLLTVNVDDPEFSSIEQKVTQDGREFYVLNVVDPKDPKIKFSLPIGGAEDAESFEVWLCEANSDFTINGKTTAKGTEKIRCYAVEE